VPKLRARRVATRTLPSARSSDIEQSRLGSALEKVDALLVGYPNFRLAHLIRGDLLLARARPLVSFGNPQDAPCRQAGRLEG
jgi:hypothetical protein